MQGHSGSFYRCSSAFLSFITLFSFILLFSSHSTIALAGTTEDVIEGAGELSTFGIDVLEDFGGGSTAEESGKARLDSLLKGKATGLIKDNLIGPAPTEGISLILKKIEAGIGYKKGKNACEIAALNQVWFIVNYASKLDILIWAANVWFDTLTAIPGASALAEKLVMDIGELAYKQLRSEIEGKIKESWAKQKDETFVYETSSGPCSIKLTVLWNKKKNKYLFIITGKCNCELISIETGGRGGKIPMQSYGIVGGGSIKPNINLSDPANPKVTLSVGYPRSIKVSADCDCAIEEELIEDPVYMPTAQTMSGSIVKAECEYCQPLLDKVNEYVADYNNLAKSMDDLAAEIQGEKYKTPLRDANVKVWEGFSKEQEEIVKKHDPAFRAFVKCEEEECKDGTDPFELPHTSDKSTTSTSCKPCQSIVDDINKLVKKHNAIAKEMNKHASIPNLKHGTVVGNKAFREWNALSKQVKDLSSQITKKLTEKTQCEATHCFGREPFKKVKLSSACDACSGIQARLNAVENEYNDLVDTVNGLWEEYRQFLIGGGAKGSKEGTDITSKAAKETRKFKGLWDKMNKLIAELRACDPSQCAVEDGTKIKIGDDFETEPDDGGATSAGDIGSFGTDTEYTVGGGGIPIDGDCTGGGCPSEPVTGTCSGDSCPDLITFKCDGVGCPDIFHLDCAITTCPSTVNIDCDAVGCNAGFIYFAYEPAGSPTGCLEYPCKEVIFANTASGNDCNFFNSTNAVCDPLSGSGSPPSGSPPSGPTIQVLPGNIPVNRFSPPQPVGSDGGCAQSHFHAASVNDCNNVLQSDPAPSFCGFGTISQITSIPLASCANP